MRERFCKPQRVPFGSVFVVATLNGRFQKVSRGLDGKRIADHAAGAPVVLYPSWMRQRDPNWPPAGQKFYINSVGVAGGDGDNQGLVNTVQPLSAPAIVNVEILVHAIRTIADTGKTRQL